MALRPDLYFADPLFYFDFCKRTFALDVALLHDYGLYDFTILVRKAALSVRSNGRPPTHVRVRE